MNSLKWTPSKHGASKQTVDLLTKLNLLCFNLTTCKKFLVNFLKTNNCNHSFCVEATV